MGRFVMLLALCLGVAGCSGPDMVMPPLQVADEHPHFAGCAAYVQASKPGEEATAERADALAKCLARNADPRQVAMRL